MQQNERIELIKAAVELTKLWIGINRDSDIVTTFDHYYDYLQLKLEAGGNANESN